MATISIIHTDETENEFELELCCETCAAECYGWNKEQYELVSSRALHNQPIRVPDSIDTDKALIAHIRSLCKPFDNKPAINCPFCSMNKFDTEHKKDCPRRC